MAMGPFQRKLHFLESKPAATFSLCSQHRSHPERGRKKKKELLPGDHLTYFTRLPFRKRRVTDCVADCSSKILFPSRCCGSPNTPCCSRTSQSTQVPYRMPRHVGVGGAICSAFLCARRYKSRFKAARLNRTKDRTRRWMWTDVGFGGRYRMSLIAQTKHFTTAARQWNTLTHVNMFKTQCSYEAEFILADWFIFSFIIIYFFGSEYGVSNSKKPAGGATERLCPLLPSSRASQQNWLSFC